MHDGHLIMVKEGQLITGRKQLSQDTGIPETTIERILKMLENEHQIGQQKTNKYRVITILNWKEHQNRTPERTTSGQQADTYKKDKKEKNTGALEDELRVEKVYESEEERPRKKLKVTKEIQAVFDIFEDNPARKVWGLHEVQRKAAATLFEEYGIDEVRNRYTVARAYRGSDMCPLINTPLDLLTKMPNMENFLKSLQS